MELRRLYLQNFLAVGDEPVEIIFDTKGGITLIKGNNQDVAGKSSNGSGKSSIVEGVTYALTGATLRKLTGPGIIHNLATKECRVEIEYDDTKIIRTLKRQAKTVKAGVEFYVNNVAKHVPSVTETNKLIDDHRGINFETLSNILIFGQHNIVSFLDAGEGEKREIIENLMNLREYNQYEQTARDHLKESKGKIKSLAEKHAVHSNYLADQQTLVTKQQNVLSEYQRVLSIDISNLEAKIASIPDIDRLRDMWRQYGEYISTKLEFEKKVGELTIENNRFQSEYNNAVATKQQLSQNKQPLIDAANTIRGKFADIDDRKRLLWQSNVHPLEAEISTAQKKSAMMEEEIKRALYSINPSEDWDMQIRSAEKHINSQSDRIHAVLHKGLKDNEPCPTCYGVVDSKNATSVVKAIESERLKLQAQLDEMLDKKLKDLKRVQKEKQQIQTEFDNSVEDRNASINHLLIQLEEAKNNVKNQYFDAKTKLEEMLATAQKQVSDFDSEINSINDPIIFGKAEIIAKSNNNIKSAQSELRRLIPIEPPNIAVDEIGKLQTQLDTDIKSKADKEHLLKHNPYAEMIETLKDSVKKIEADVAAANKEIKDVEAILPYSEFWVSHFGREGLKSFVIDQIIPTLNQQIEYWMQLIYQGTITVKFDKYFNVSMVNSASKNEMIFGQGSGGERRRIDIAIMLAFRQVMKMSTGKDPSIIYFDECCENLDEQGVRAFYNVLSDVAKTTRCYVITHNVHLLDLLQNSDTINVTKRDGAMRIA